MTRKVKLLILVFFALSPTHLLNAQTTTEEITDRFFETYKNSPLEAVDYIFNTNKWMERNQDAIQNVKTQLTSFLGLVGDLYGHERITEKNIGESYKLVSYMVKYDRQPIRFTFIFYKPKDKWQVQNFKFDDSLDSELEESAKAYRLQENW